MLIKLHLREKQELFEANAALRQVHASTLGWRALAGLPRFFHLARAAGLDSAAPKELSA